MKRDEFHELILNELQEVKKEIKEVRQTDIPRLQVTVAGFKSDVKKLEHDQKLSTRLHTIIGGAIAVAITKFTGHS